MKGLMANLGCGDAFIRADSWVNLDYAPVDETVQQADLLRPLPLPSDSAAVVYSSHFVEHLPRSRVPGFLSECFRVLQPGGVVRLVLPDFEEMCREYLARRARGDDEKADFVVIEIIDQCVRPASGGELGALYDRYSADPDGHAEMVEYVRTRTGQDLIQAWVEPASRSTPPRPPKARWSALPLSPRSARRRLSAAWFRWLLDRLPGTFREQNVSMAAVGERHHWLWDLHQLAEALEAAGFESVERCRHDSSRVPGSSFRLLDTTEDGRPRKGSESMYVEASKPC